MKIKIFLTICISIFALSCDSYVDDAEVFGENTDNFFQDEEDYQSALIGVYDLLGSTYMSVMIGEIASDNALCGGENPNDTPGWQTIDDMTHNADNDQLLSYWQWMYGGITRASVIIENQDRVDFEGKAQLLAETRFLRAYFYFELVKFFGNIPYLGDGVIDVNDVSGIGQTPKSEVYAALKNELQTAIPNLPWAAAEPGRATKGAAYALLGKICLFDEDFTGAKDALDPVILSGQYDLIEDYSQIFLLSNENNLESVFEIQYIGDEGYGWDVPFSYIEGNIVPGFSGPRFRGGDYTPYADGWSFNIPTTELESQFADEDIRKTPTIFNLDEFVAAHPDVTYVEGNEHTGLFNGKYMPYAEGNAPPQNVTHSNNYRAIRFSDVLLMAAEAYNRGNFSDMTAKQYLNRVRLRANLPNITSSGAQLTQDIWDERRKELAGEGHRFFDQVRTNQTSSIPNFTPGKNEVFPIPATEIILSGSSWTQNPGY